ncbi:Endonuclease/exonuclease/phosphatase [Sparassis latifolia]
MSDDRLRVFTFNCWGLKYVSKNRAERISAIADALVASDYDLITLQEVWVFADYELIRAAVSKRLPYSKFFYSGAFGAGLAILSRFPIIATTIHSYTLNGSPIDVIQGDWFVGKAAGSALIAHPILGQVQVFDTHLYAPGGDSGPIHQQAHRYVNAWEFAKLTRQAADVGRYVIAAGDFNSIPSSVPMAIIREHAGLTDAWVATHPNAPVQTLAGPSPALTSPHDAIRLYGVTADSPLNTYSAGKHLEPVARKYQGKRLDYIFYRQPSISPPSGRNPILKCVDTNVVFTQTIPRANFSFSDHFGVEATFEISRPENGDIETHVAALAEPGSVLNSSSIPNPSLSPDSINRTLSSLTSRYRYAQHRGRSQLTVFGSCTSVIIFMALGSAWLPQSWINPIFVVATIFLSWLATTMFYVGFVYTKWEANALTNVIEELEIYRDSLEGLNGRNEL